MNSAKRAVMLAQLCTRQFAAKSASKASGQSKPSGQFKSLKQKQEKFQCDDGLPVFLKGGITDKIFYQGTILLILVGTGMMGKLFWDLAVPQKND